VHPKLIAEKVQAELTPKVPPEARYDLHVALIRHGREICVARRPRCSECPVFEFCEAGPRLLAAGEAR
jgi:endonuclease-3